MVKPSSLGVQNTTNFLGISTSAYTINAHRTRTMQHTSFMLDSIPCSVDPLVIIGQCRYIQSVAMNMMNRQLWTANKGSPPTWGQKMGLTTPYHKKLVCYKLSVRHND
jgi:hypothetical protein